jgi:hypothetical protein
LISQGWLAVKNMLHTSNHALKQQEFPDSSSHLMLPIMKDGSDDQVLHEVYDGETQVVLPANILGDHCNGRFVLSDRSGMATVDLF